MDFDDEVLTRRRPTAATAAASKTAASAAGTNKPQKTATIRNMNGRKAGKPIQTPTATTTTTTTSDDADSMLDEFRFSDTPPSPETVAVASRKKQHPTVTHHQQQWQQRRQKPFCSTRDDDSDGSRFSGGSNDDENEKDRNNNKRTLLAAKRTTEAIRSKKSHNRLLQKEEIPPQSSLDIINVDDDDDDDYDDASAASSGGGKSGRNMFDGVPIDRCIDPRRKEYVDSVNRRLGNGCHGRDNSDYDDDDHNGNIASQKGAAAITASAADIDGAATAGKKKFRGNHHAPSSMAQPLSPHFQGSRRITRTARVESLPSRISTYDDPLDEAQYQQEQNRPNAAYNSFIAHSRMKKPVENAKGKGTSENRYQRSTTSSNNYNNSRAGTYYSSQSRSNTTNTTTTSRNKVKFGEGSMDTKRAQHAEVALHQKEAKNSRSEKKLQQQQLPQHQKQQEQQQPVGIMSGVKRQVEKVIDVVTSPWKKRRSSPKEDEAGSDNDNSTIAVQSAEGHPINIFDKNSMGENNDDEIVDVINACGRVNSEDIQCMTPKHTPPSAESADDLDNSQPSSAAFSLENYFGLKRYTKECTSAMKKKPHFSDLNSHLRRSKRTEDTIDPSPSCSHRNNCENNPASQQQKKKQRPQSSNTVDSKSTTRVNSRLKKDPAQPTCEDWFRKSTKQGMILDDNYDNDEEYEFDGTYEKSSKKRSNPPPPRRSSASTRSSARLKGAKGKGVDDVITIDSSDEGDDTSLSASPDVRAMNKRAAGDVPCIDAVRIAIGKKVFKTKCTLKFQLGTRHPYIQFSFEVGGNLKEHRVDIDHGDELKEVKYHIAAEDDAGVKTGDTITVISFRITPSEKNSLTKYSNAYNQEEGGMDLAKNYISVEPRNTDDFQALLYHMREHNMMGAWCTAESEFRFSDLEKYASALLEDIMREEDERLKFMRVTRSGGRREATKKKSENKLLLVYPFEVDEAVLSGSATGLTELGGKMFGLEVEPPDDSDALSDNKKLPQRTHYITICEDDKERLQPRQFLNDTIVDFWMRWISRGVSKQPNSNVHFFTSHFMTTLKDEGIQAVASWTANKNINVFDKKLIFIPINANLHWSLCVVVNPGHIANSFSQEGSPDQKRSCILFFDSLRMHNKHTYAMLIRQWLNSEWKRLNRGKVGGSTIPFDKENHMPLLTPRIPYQDNGCDCGVFVCRYAYSLFVMRGSDFTLGDMDERPTFNSLITRGVAFQFDQSDIPRIRKEIASLIDNLSDVYLPIRKEQEDAEKRAKAAEKKARRNKKCNEPAETNDDEKANIPETTLPASSGIGDLQHVEAGNVAVDDFGFEKEDENGSNKIASLVDSLSEVSVSVRNKQVKAKSKAQRNVPTDVGNTIECTISEARVLASCGNGEKENEVESNYGDKTDFDDETVLLSSSDSDEIDRTTPPASISYDDELVEAHRTTSL